MFRHPVDYQKWRTAAMAGKVHRKNVAPPMFLNVRFSKKLTNGKLSMDEFNKRFDEFLDSGRLRHIYDKFGMKTDYDKLGSKDSASFGKSSELTDSEY